MKNKIVGILICTLLISAMTIIPRNIHVIATDDYGDPEIDYLWIYNKTANLSEVGKYYERGRYFGTDGEQEATRAIENWMKNISLDCVHNETIDAYWTYGNENITKLKNLPYSLYIGKLSKARVMQDYWIKITIYNKNPWSVIEYKNLTGTNCFPSFQRVLPIIKNYINIGNNITVNENFQRWVKGAGWENLEQQMELGDTHWSIPNKVID